MFFLATIILFTNSLKFLPANTSGIIFNKVLPKEIAFVNKTLDKKGLKNIVAEAFRICSHDDTIKLLDDIKDIAFKFITVSGLSWGMNDIPKLKIKAQLKKELQRRIEETLSEFLWQEFARNEDLDRLVEDIWKQKTDPCAAARRVVSTWLQLKDLPARKGT